MSIHPKAQSVASHVGYEWKMLEFSYRMLEQLKKLEYLSQVGEELTDHVEMEFSSIADSEFTENHLVDPMINSSGRGDPFINILLEDFLLHVRVVRDFLTKQEKDRFRPGTIEEDILASDFFDDGEEWNQLQLEPALECCETRLNRALAHLSYERIEFEQGEGWYTREIYEALKEMWNTFWNRLPEQRRCWFPLDKSIGVRYWEMTRRDEVD